MSVLEMCREVSYFDLSRHQKVAVDQRYGRYFGSHRPEDPRRFIYYVNMVGVIVSRKRIITPIPSFFK